MPSNPTPVPLPQVVGFRLRQHRELAGLRQDDVATAAQRLGLAWGRSSVAMLEAGKRRLSAEELLLMPYILDEAIRVARPDAGMGFSVSLAELLAPGPSERLALSDVFTLTAQQVDDWLEAEPAIDTFPLATDVPEADRHAARTIKVPVEVVQEAARRMWARSLSEERDHRVAEQTTGEMHARSRQTHRGLVTRQLLAELRSAVKET